MVQIPLIFDCVLSATGTAASAVRVTETAQIVSCILDGEVQDILVLDGATAQVSGNVYDVATTEGSGVLEPLQGDRSAWDALDYATRHANDIDNAAGIHHTLGSGGGQAAPGNHTHTHASTTGQTTDDHHAKSHAHDGADGSGTVAHSALTSVSANQHHNQAHILGAGGDHSDAPANQAHGFVKRNAANAAWEEVPYGTITNTVAEGNHTHGGEVLMAEGITPPSPLFTEDGTDWLYTEG